MNTVGNKNAKQYFFVLWELTKRELRRKYARSNLGILWSVFYPLLRMALVVFLFSNVFDKGIELYPAYYFSAFLNFEFFKTATETSLTTLKDNKNLLIKSKLERNLLVLSRVLTALVNMLLGCIPYVGVLLVSRVMFTWRIGLVFVNLFFLILFTTGISYMLSVWYVFFPDAKKIYEKIIFILRFFVVMFYSIERVPDIIKRIIIRIPLYTYINISRECTVYGRTPESFYFVQMAIYGVLAYLIGKWVFKYNENRVVEKL